MDSFAELQKHFNTQRGNPRLSPQEIAHLLTEIERGDFDEPEDDYAFKRVLLLLLVNIVVNTNRDG
jgi:hypothetical protein